MVRRLRRRVALAETALAQATAAKTSPPEPATPVLRITNFFKLPHFRCFSTRSLPSSPPSWGTIHQGCEGIEQRRLLTSPCDFRDLCPSTPPLGERQCCERPTGGRRDDVKQRRPYRWGRRGRPRPCGRAAVHAAPGLPAVRVQALRDDPAGAGGPAVRGRGGRASFCHPLPSEIPSVPTSTTCLQTFRHLAHAPTLSFAPMHRACAFPRYACSASSPTSSRSSATPPPASGRWLCGAWSVSCAAFG